MEPHSWIIAIAGMAYLYFLCQIFDQKKVYLIQKSRISQPDDTDLDGIRIWQIEVKNFKKDIQSFRVKSIVSFCVIPLVEMIFHLYFGEHYAQVWIFSLAVFLFFLIGLIVLLYDMRQHDKFEEKRYKSPTSLLFN